jgi:hypothetical protein
MSEFWREPCIGDVFAVVSNLPISKTCAEGMTLHDVRLIFDAFARELKRLNPRTPYDLEQYAANTAKICHEANRALCEAFGDTSQVPWERAPAWQKNSSIDGVWLHFEGDHGPEASHAAWMKSKLDEGWVYGPTKDPEAKTHPCLVPFDQLPREQQAKDYVFRAIATALRPEWGYAPATRPSSAQGEQA